MFDCTSSVAEPYSKSYVNERTAPGNLPFFRSGISGICNSWGINIPKKNPRLSITQKEGRTPDEILLCITVSDTGMGIKKEDIATLFDAFIQCWYVKYKYNTVRPETVINQYIDINWRPYLQTPAFPEYTCGHSTISSAAAEALTSVYGDNFAYTDSTELEFGIANRSFKSFRHAADENNWARFYGGLHFHNSCIISTDIGQKVGKHIATKLKMKK